MYFSSPPPPHRTCYLARLASLTVWVMCQYFWFYPGKFSCYSSSSCHNSSTDTLFTGTVSPFSSHNSSIDTFLTGRVSSSSHNSSIDTFLTGRVSSSSHNSRQRHIPFWDSLFLFLPQHQYRHIPYMERSSSSHNSSIDTLHTYRDSRSSFLQ